MRRNDDLLRENEALRRRVSALSAAYLRINASLDLDTVLREVVDSARVLTGARYGAVNTLDDYGQPRDFVTSGLTDEEQRRLMQWPDATRLFVHILPGVLEGQEDDPERLRPNGFSAGPLTFRETPMHHQGRHLGNCYLAGKERGGEFTSADDEAMALFARQAAGAIANARAYRAEHLARAGLEALADSAPIQGMERIQIESLDLVRRELRAPLASIKGSAATALGASPVPSPAEMLQVFRIINEQADHMSSFITDLLDAGRIDSGMLALTPEPTAAAALPDQARNTFLGSIVKPFSPTELVARIRTALRNRAKSGQFTLGELTINYDRRRVALSGRPVKLTATEYELLRVLSLNAGRVSTYATLQRRVWGRHHHGASKLVRAYVSKLRRKLGDDTAQPTYIFTETGAGYRMPNPSDL